VGYASSSKRTHSTYASSSERTHSKRCVLLFNYPGAEKKERRNSGMPRVGLGIYHSGIEVFGREISFGYADAGMTFAPIIGLFCSLHSFLVNRYADAGMTGVFEVPPRCAPGVMTRTTFKESVLLGYMFRSAFEVDHILQVSFAPIIGLFCSYNRSLLLL
jgi:hypothetical protein